MKIRPRYRMPFKRRMEIKTDYRRRLKLLSSKKLRLVVRKSSKHIRAQIAEFHPKGDRILVSVTSQDLKKYGWDGSIENTTAAYLVGLLIGKRALKKNIKSLILDMGLQKNVKGSRVYAVLKGSLDAGLTIPHSPDILPTDDRISGKHIVSYAQKLKEEDEERYKRQFSKSKPVEMPGMFEKVKSRIMKE